ncbi:MAG: OmpA family protein [Bacteroidales bacterium]|nr:OmpA family protein [Bacteroidales bacterium]
MKFKIYTLVLFGIILSSCVSKKQFQTIKTANERTAIEKDSLQTALTEVKALKEVLDSKNELLEKDTSKLGIEKRETLIENAKLNELNNQLINNQSKLMQENAIEAKKILAELQTTRADLIRREDSLEILDKNLKRERAVVEQMKNELGLKEEVIKAKNVKLAELESVLRKKDSVTRALKTKISAALLGFEGNGLSIVQRDGKIYVSVDEELLFQVGKADVAIKGQDALKKLAIVLEKNSDINIMVEGHTDNTGSEKINWELSTKRAHAITAILLDNSNIDGKRITVAGRGQFAPLDKANTVEARSKNRRSEIILTPDLGELFSIINE